MKARSRALFLALAWFAVLPAASFAQPYPSKPIRLIVGAPPGGTTDVVGRLIAPRLGDRLGPGASGMIGADAVAKASPDGYTLLMAPSQLATYTSLYRKVPFDPVKDLEPIGFVATSSYVMVVHPSLPVKSVSDLIQLAKAKPGELNYAASSPGGAQQLAWELFKRSTGTDMSYVPYKGTGQPMPDLLAGRLQAAIDNVAVLTQYVKNGSLRGLAVTSLNRSPLLPDLPTVAESGIPGFDVAGWFGVYAPANMPREIVKQLNEAMVNVMARSDTKNRLTELGLAPASGSQEELRKLLAREMSVWGKVIREAGIKAE